MLLAQDREPQITRIQEAESHAKTPGFLRFALNGKAKLAEPCSAHGAARPFALLSKTISLSAICSRQACRALPRLKKSACASWREIALPASYREIPLPAS